MRSRVKIREKEERNRKKMERKRNRESGRNREIEKDRDRESCKKNHLKLTFIKCIVTIFFGQGGKFFFRAIMPNNAYLLNRLT